MYDSGQIIDMKLGWEIYEYVLFFLFSIVLLFSSIGLSILSEYYNQVFILISVNFFVNALTTFVLFLTTIRQYAKYNMKNLGKIIIERGLSITTTIISVVMVVIIDMCMYHPKYQHVEFDTILIAIQILLLIINFFCFGSVISKILNMRKTQKLY